MHRSLCISETSLLHTSEISHPHTCTYALVSPRLQFHENSHLRISTFLRECTSVVSCIHVSGTQHLYDTYLQSFFASTLLSHHVSPSWCQKATGPSRFLLSMLLCFRTHVLLQFCDHVHSHLAISYTYVSLLIGSSIFCSLGITILGSRRCGAFQLYHSPGHASTKFSDLDLSHFLVLSNIDLLARHLERSHLQNSNSLKLLHCCAYRTSVYLGLPPHPGPLTGRHFPTIIHYLFCHP